MAKYSLILLIHIIGVLLSPPLLYALPQEKVDVKAMGAKGDGITNDTKAIKAAFARLYATGGEVYFPEGTYMTDIIDIRPNEGVTITISGKENKTFLIKRKEDLSTTALFFCEIQDVSLIFNALNLNGAASGKLNSWVSLDEEAYTIATPTSGIFVYNLEELVVTNCTIENFNGEGIAAYTTANFIVKNCKVKNVNGSGIKGHRVKTMNASHNIIEHTGFIPQEYMINNVLKKKASFFPRTKFGDGIEAECQYLTATHNIIINPGRCGIVHDLAIDLGYKQSVATVTDNTITINSPDINNNNPPAGMWFEQSAKVNVLRNKVSIVESYSKIVTGIRFYGITDSIYCIANTINATEYNQVSEHGIGIFEPLAKLIYIIDNEILGKFESGVAISYEKHGSYINELFIEKNKFYSSYGSMKYGIMTYTGENTLLPVKLEIGNNIFKQVQTQVFHINPK